MACSSLYIFNVNRNYNHLVPVSIGAEYKKEKTGLPEINENEQVDLSVK
jgi:hypothetical protein